MSNQEELKQMLEEMLNDGAPIEVHEIVITLLSFHQ